MKSTFCLRLKNQLGKHAQCARQEASNINKFKKGFFGKIFLFRELKIKNILIFAKELKVESNLQKKSCFIYRFCLSNLSAASKFSNVSIEVITAMSNA